MSEHGLIHRAGPLLMILEKIGSNKLEELLHDTEQFNENAYNVGARQLADILVCLRYNYHLFQTYFLSLSLLVWLRRSRNDIFNSPPMPRQRPTHHECSPVAI